MGQSEPRVAAESGSAAQSLALRGGRWHSPRPLNKPLLPHSLRLGVFAVFALIGACDSGGDGPPVAYCTASADCPASMFCVFPVPGGCGAQGQCETIPDAACAPEPVCSCAGETEAVCVVGGYTTTQERALGACGATDAGATDASAPDAGATDAGVTAASDAAPDSF